MQKASLPVTNSIFFTIVFMATVACRFDFSGPELTEKKVEAYIQVSSELRKEVPLITAKLGRALVEDKNRVFDAAEWTAINTAVEKSDFSGWKEYAIVHTRVRNLYGQIKEGPEKERLQSVYLQNQNNLKSMIERVEDPVQKRSLQASFQAREEAHLQQMEELERQRKHPVPDSPEMRIIKKYAKGLEDLYFNRTAKRSGSSEAE